MELWRIKNYVTEQGKNLIRDWYGEQDEAVQADFDTAVLLARATDNWTDPERWWFKELTEKHAGLSEFRITVRAKLGKRRFRPVGIYRPGVKEFVFILGCEKRLGGLIYVPANAFDTAMKFKTALENGQGTLDDHV